MTRFVCLSFAIITMVAFGVHAATAQTIDSDFGIFELRQTLNLPEGDPFQLAGALINKVLSFLGLLTLVIFLWGGFLFMFSGGKKEKTDQAKAIIMNGIIGLIIILCSWTVVRFVFDTLINVTANSI